VPKESADPEETGIPNQRIMGTVDQRGRVRNPALFPTEPYRGPSAANDCRWTGGTILDVRMMTVR